jgi:hypothetical protein
MIAALRRLLTPKQTARQSAREAFLDAQVEYYVAVGRGDTRRQREASKALVEAGKRKLMVGA